MPNVWQVRVKGGDGALAALLTGERGGFAGFSFMRNVNSAGAFALYMMRRADETTTEFIDRTDLFELDGQIEFRRRWPEQGVNWQMEFEGLVRSREWYVNENNVLMFAASGRGYLDLLHRRHIDAASGSPEAAKTGPAETIAKAYVTEQAGSGAAAARQITGLSVQADGAAGSTVHITAPYKNLLGTLREIARLGDGDFDVVGTGAATYEFRWYDGQRGTDRSSTVEFSYERGNMGAPRLTRARHDEINAVLVAGQGHASDRETVWRTTDTLIDDSTWNRIEGFKDQRDEPNTDGLNDAGDVVLDEHKPRAVLSFEPLQTPGMLLGKHYFFGDKVAVQFLEYSATQKVKGYTWTVNESTGPGGQVTVELADV